MIAMFTSSIQSPGPSVPAPPPLVGICTICPALPVVVPSSNQPPRVSNLPSRGILKLASWSATTSSQPSTSSPVALAPIPVNAPAE